jgi:hypothetical protein
MDNSFGRSLARRTAELLQTGNMAQAGTSSTIYVEEVEIISYPLPAA